MDAKLFIYVYIIIEKSVSLCVTRDKPNIIPDANVSVVGYSQLIMRSKCKTGI